MSEPFEETLFEALVDDTTMAGDLSEQARQAEPANFLRHAASLSMTKLADGLIDPKLVLSWLLSSLGAPAALIGLLVPIREAGALLPQLFLAGRVHAMARRKWAWASGTLGQGIAAGAIAVTAVSLSGIVAGVAVCLSLAVLAVSRSLCSVSYKDVLGKTVGKTRRGTATGLASSVAPVGVIMFAILLISGLTDRYILVIAALFLATFLWLAAAALFTGIAEQASPNQKTGSALGQLSLLRQDRQLLYFVVVRGLLVSTALAPPYLVILGSGERMFEQLGTLVLASSAASLLSSYIWGRMADRSSRRVLQLSGLMGAFALCLAVALSLLGQAGSVIGLAFVLFLLMVAYHGVRQGRSTYLVDMAPADRRAAYTAVSNTVIGIILLATGGFGAVTAIFGVTWTLAVFATMSLGAAILAQKLDEVE